MGFLGVVIENWVWPERSASWGSIPLISIRVHKALGPTHIPFHCALGTLYQKGWELWQRGREAVCLLACDPRSLWHSA